MRSNYLKKGGRRLLFFTTSAISPNLAEDGRVPRRGASRSLHPLSSVPMFLLTFSLRMERMTLTMLTLVSGTLHRTKAESDAT